MLLSIVIPVFNVRDYVRKCINSVLSTDDQEAYEIIIIDDGSTDGSGDICDEYTWRRNLTVIHQKNGGLSAARNSGLKAAKGEYVYFLDSDDYLADGALTKLIEILKSNHLDLVCCNALINNNNLINVSKNFIGDSGEELCEFFFKERHIYYLPEVWLYCYRREFLNIHNLTFLEGFLHEDEDFTPRVLSKARRSAYFNISILNHTINREGSIMYQIDTQHISHLIFILRRFSDEIRNGLHYSPCFMHSFFKLYVQAIKSIKQNGYKYNEFVTNYDIDNLSLLSRSTLEKRAVTLYRVSLDFAERYYHYSCPSIVRHFINTLLFYIR